MDWRLKFHVSVSAFDQAFAEHFPRQLLRSRLASNCAPLLQSEKERTYAYSSRLVHCGCDLGIGGP
jgi:hypothetical protein